MQIYAASKLLPITAPPIDGGAVAVENGRIVAIGTLAELQATCHGTVTEFPGCVIMPGLVNAHTHLELTHFPSWKIRKGIDYSPRSYVDWIVQVVKIRRALTREELSHSLREGVGKSVEAGTTAVGDILTDRSLLGCFNGTHLAGRVYFEAIGHEPGHCAMVKREIEQALAAFADGNLLAGISPHAPHTLSADFLRELTALAAANRLPTMIHLSESAEEAAFFHDSSGRIAEDIYPMAGWGTYIPSPRRTTSTAWLDSLGVLTPETAAIHCVHITPSDAAILKARGVTAVLCPRSNDRLAVGRAPAALLKKCGVPLALGTDSLASNDSLSMWDEMRFFRREFPALFSPAEVLELATIGAAGALEMQDSIGSLATGKRGDFLVVRPPVSGSAELTEGVIEEGHLEEVFIGGMRLER